MLGGIRYAGRRPPISIMDIKSGVGVPVDNKCTTASRQAHWELESSQFCAALQRYMLENGAGLTSRPVRAGFSGADFYVTKGLPDASTD